IRRLPAGVLLHLAARVLHPDDLILWVFLVGKTHRAIAAKDLVGSLERPAELPFLGPSLAVGAADVIEAGPGGNEPHDLPFREPPDRFEPALKLLHRVPAAPGREDGGRSAAGGLRTRCSWLGLRRREVGYETRERGEQGEHTDSESRLLARGHD